MKRFMLLAGFLALFHFTLAAQVASDPNDPLYRWMSIWEEKGYVRNLPFLRPYPIQLLEKILMRVKDVGTDEEASLADLYLRELSVTIGDTRPNRSLPAPLTLSVTNSFWTKFDSLRDDALITTVLQGKLGDLFSFSGTIAWGGMVATPGFYGPEWLQISDESESGGGSAVAGDLTFWAKNLGTAQVVIGTHDLFFQAGMMRSSFGPFFENGAVIGPQAPAAGHFSFTYLADWIRISSIMMVAHPLYYRNSDDRDIMVIDSYNRSTHENYLIIHSYAFTPWDWLEFGFLQTVLLNGSLNPVFLIPLVHSFFAQQLYGDENTSLIGLFAKFRLPANFEFKFLLYVDDFNTDTFFGNDGRSGLFSLDNSQNKVALQGGITWTPENPVLRRVRLDYLMVTPYTYTHNSEKSQLSYTHMDVGIGTLLEPNSDQISLDVFLTPLSWFNLTFTGRFARHGNASEDLVYGGDAGAGGYYDDGYTETEITFIGPMRFLTQDVIEYVLQLGVDADFTFGLGWGELALGIGYLFEFTANKDLIDGTLEFNHFVKVFTKLTF